jgi:hypothetical protein
MDSIGVFPFGQPIFPLVQKDRSKKRVFVLGVYASAVHARWVWPTPFIRGGGSYDGPAPSCPSATGRPTGDSFRALGKITRGLGEKSFSKRSTVRSLTVFCYLLVSWLPQNSRRDALNNAIHY